jgi:hypothetical protein
MREEHIPYGCDCIYQLGTLFKESKEDSVTQNVMQILAGTEGRR